MSEKNINPPRSGEGDRVKRGGGGVASLRKPTVYTARRLRRNMTLPEVKLWNELRGKKLGVKFRRQHPIGPYIADFFCYEKKLVVEVDGDIHSMGNNPERDNIREKYITAHGYHIIRFAASAVLNNIEAVVIAIVSALESPHHRETRFPSPQTGRI